MNLDDLEIISFIPDTGDSEAQLIPLTNSVISIGGPNGAGKSELLLRLGSCFSGDASKLRNFVTPGIILKFPSTFFDLKEASTTIPPEEFEDKSNDLFLTDLFDGIGDQFFFGTKEKIWPGIPDNYESLKECLGVALGFSLKFNLELNVSAASKKLDRMEPSIGSPDFPHTELWDKKIQKLGIYTSYLKESILGQDNFIDQFVDSFLEDYKLLLIPVGTQELPQWNVYLLNNNIPETINPLSAVLQSCSIPDDYFLESPLMLPDLSLKREFLSYFATRYEKNPWLLINLGVVSSKSFIVINPDSVTLDEIRSGVAKTLEKSFKWNNLTINSLSGEEVAEKKISIASWRLSDFLNSLNEPKRTKSKFETSSPFLEIGSEKFIEVSRAVREWQSTQNAEINGLIRLILPTFPDFEITINEYHEWPTKGLFSLFIRHQHISMDLEDLSPIQQRWFKFIMLFWLYQYQARPVIIIDEPERGLQRNLESQLESVLQAFAPSSLIFTATHSSSFLKSPQVIGIHIDKNGRRSYTSFFGSLYSHLKDFDISEAEYFETYSLIVFTEGERDKAMLEGFAAGEFDKNRILIISGNGLRSWSGLFDSQIFPMLSSPKILFLIDGVERLRMNETIDKCRKKSGKGFGTLNFLLRDEIPTWSDGPPLGKDLLITFAGSIARALTAENASKIYFDATGDRDCIEWLPIESFPISEKSWDQVWLKAAEVNKRKFADGEQFKAYLSQEVKKRNPRLGVSPAHLKEMSSMLTLEGKVPVRILELLNRIITLSKN